MTRRPSTGEEDPAQNNELMMAQMIAHFCHTNNELFSGIEHGLTGLRDKTPFDDKSLARIETLIKACARGRELAAQMLASSRMPGVWTDIEKT